MKRFALALLPTLAAASAFAQTSTEKVNLTYVTPAGMMDFIKAAGPSQTTPHLPEGIDSVELDEKNNCLLITGKPEAAANLKKMIALFDVQPRQVLTNLKLIRYSVGTSGPARQELLQQPTISTTSNYPATITLVKGETEQFTVRILPTINSDDTVTISVFSLLAIPGVNNQASRMSFQATRRIKQHKETRLYGFSDSPNPQVQAALRQGKLPEVAGVAYTAYFIDVKASEPETFSANPLQR